jgi:two-component system OmpR family response regulator
MPRVVIVDSNRDGVEMYVTALAFEGIEAAPATSASEALDVIERTHPKAVVTGLRLPDTGTAELIERVRRALPDGFILGLSASGASEAEEARHAGCDVVLSMPCLPETLVQQLRRALN